MNYARIRDALPLDNGMGRRSVLRARPDVGQIAADLVLRTYTREVLAKRIGMDIEALARFNKKFITDEVRKIILVESRKKASTDLDAEVMEGQDEIQTGLRGILKEQKDLYKQIKEKIGDGRDVEDVLPALAQLLRDQGQSFERLLKSYSALRDKTTIVLSLNEHPDVTKLMDVLYVVFEHHPDAFATFQQVLKQKRVPLDVE